MLCENKDLKFIVFAFHRQMLDGITEQLIDSSVKFIRIDGSTVGHDRPVSWKPFFLIFSFSRHLFIFIVFFKVFIFVSSVNFLLQRLISQFQNDTTTRVALLSIKAAGVVRSRFQYVAWTDNNLKMINLVTEGWLSTLCCWEAAVHPMTNHGK